MKNPTEKTQEKPKDRRLEKKMKKKKKKEKNGARELQDHRVREPAATGSGQEAVFSVLMGTGLETAVVERGL